MPGLTLLIFMMNYPLFLWIYYQYQQSMPSYVTFTTDAILVHAFLIVIFLNFAFIFALLFVKKTQTWSVGLPCVLRFLCYMFCLFMVNFALFGVLGNLFAGSRAYGTIYNNAGSLLHAGFIMLALNVSFLISILIVRGKNR